MGKKAKKKSKRKQPDLPAMQGPGVEEKQIDEIDEIASEYVKARDERMALLEQEVASKSRLKTAMDKHNLKAYKFDGLIVSIEPGEETIKVKKIKSADEESE